MKKHYSADRKRSIYRKRVLDICCFLIVVFFISVAVLYFTKKDFANELRQIRQANANNFYIGIDVSQTIKPEVLDDFTDALISRLKNFTGEKKAFYQVSLFGIPGCGKDAVIDLVSTKSPDDPDSFRRKIEKKIKGISVARKSKGGDDNTPLTTPLFFFLDKTLTESAGHRIIILSDLVNDEAGCQSQHSFPLEAINNFAADKEGQIIFLFPKPHTAGKYDTAELNEKLLKKQEDFIMEMQKLSREGKVRAFFYRVPDDPQQTLRFFKSQLQKSIPATTFDIIWERVSRMIDTVVGAVRG
jgi:hypothetical protein